MIRVLIGGDICPMGKAQPAFAAGRASEIFHDLLPEIRSADLAVANLECPLVSRPSPIVKTAEVLRAPPDCIRGLVDARWDILNLANNHSYDHGSVGLRETIATIQQAGLAVVGAGDNLEAAGTPVVRHIKGQRIVIYSMAEREFSVADVRSPGANPLDLISFVQAARKHKQGGIFITLLHGGKEYYPYPSPEMVRRCRFMIDMGADAVICCHTHCPLPWEIYANRPIVYGLGNLLFEAENAPLPSWHQGYLARLEIEGNEVHFEPLPYIQSLGAVGAQAMNEADTKVFHEELKKRGEELKDPMLLELKWLQFCRSLRPIFLSTLFAYSPPMRRLRRVLLSLLHSRRQVLHALLVVQCETHREVLETIFKEERQRP